MQQSEASLDLVIRNTRLASQPEAGPVDIGIASGKIVAIETGITADAPSFDAQGLLGCAGLVETHIHLDKTRIIDRCPPEDGRNAKRPQFTDHCFTGDYPTVLTDVAGETGKQQLSLLAETG